MARQRNRNTEPVVNIDEIDFIVIATEHNLKYWKVMPPNEKAKPHIKILEESVIELGKLKARRDAGEDIEAEKTALIKKNGDATMALNQIGPEALMDMLRGGNMPSGLSPFGIVTPGKASDWK
jgi:hypothetical protein